MGWTTCKLVELQVGWINFQSVLSHCTAALQSKVEKNIQSDCNILSCYLHYFSCVVGCSGYYSYGSMPPLQVRVRKHGDAKKYNAHVIHVGHECDIAMVTICCVN